MSKNTAKTVSAQAPLMRLDSKYRDTIIQMMRSQSYRELAAAQLFGYGVQFVPDIKALKFISWHIQEEVQHYIAVADLYKKHVGESVESWVNDRLASKPLPSIHSFLDLAIAQWLYDRGGFWQLKEYEQCSWEPYRTIVGQIIKEERGHQDHGQQIAVELCKKIKDKTDAQKSFELWLRQGLLSFGRPHNEGNKYAISVGLKKRDSAECMKDFMNDIMPAVRETGLKLPKKEKFDVELPDDINWTI
ncbi:MAG: phenylacetate-CoA oxygenase subunit PaaI [Planctomycetes bacterium]|nr:phenylacetate-CoA oxygenase subunit PaaI [Planctomycetota bacterium]